MRYVGVGIKMYFGEAFSGVGGDGGDCWRSERERRSVSGECILDLSVYSSHTRRGLGCRT